MAHKAVLIKLMKIIMTSLYSRTNGCRVQKTIDKILYSLRIKNIELSINHPLDIYRHTGPLQPAAPVSVSCFHVQ